MLTTIAIQPRLLADDTGSRLELDRASGRFWLTGRLKQAEPNTGTATSGPV